jgi:hypothetical protein
VGQPVIAVASARRRTALGIATATVSAGLLVAALALAGRTALPPPPARQLVVLGRVTGTDGQPVSGIKVWLNAWPRPGVKRSPQMARFPCEEPRAKADPDVQRSCCR